MHEYFDIIGGVRWDYFSANQENKLPGKWTSTAWTSCSVTAAAWFFIRRRQQSYYFSYASSFNPSAEGLTSGGQQPGDTAGKKRDLRNRQQIFVDGRSPHSPRRRYSRSRRPMPAPTIRSSACKCSTASSGPAGFEFSVAGRILPGWNVFGRLHFSRCEDPQVQRFQVVEGVTYSTPGQGTAEHAEIQRELSGPPTTFWTNGRSAAGRLTSAAASRTMPISIEFPGYIRWDSTVAYNITEKIQLPSERSESYQPALH